MRLPGITVAGDELSSDDWYTPPYIIEAIGLSYDLDPCAPPGGVPWIPADHHYTIDDDGLAQSWEGRVWLNPPYSKPYPWVERLAAHGNGIGLVPADTSTRGWHRWVVRGNAVLFLRDRVQFVQPGNDNVTSARFPSALVAFGEDNAAALQQSSLGWFVARERIGPFFFDLVTS